MSYLGDVSNHGYPSVLAAVRSEAEDIIRKKKLNDSKIIRYVKTVNATLINSFIKLYVYENAINDDTCDALKSIVTKNMIDSSIPNCRQSKSAVFSITDRLIHTVNAQISGMIGIDSDDLEGVQGVHYENNGFYNAHSDYFEHNEPNVSSRTGTKIMTVRLYLEDLMPENNGELEFPIISYSIKPAKGMLVFWENVSYGVPSIASVHNDRQITGATNTYLVNHVREHFF